MPRRKALKVVVDIHLHAITCPGVFLPEQQDVFMYIELLGQRKRTQSIPPVFPFLFHEKLRFDKVFSHCTDPVQIASALDGETVRLELVQLSYPAGELLATYEDNARDFLFPTPRACPAYPGVDREVLLQRASSFSGIAPKLEFSSRTIIKEVTTLSSGIASSRRKKEKNESESGLNSYKPSCSSYKQIKAKSSTPRTSSNYPPSSKKKTTQRSSSSNRRGRARTRAASLNRGTTHWGYEQPTVASLARSPSPYTRRRMAELSIKDRFDSEVKTKPFKTELEERRDFVVRKASSKYLSHSKDLPVPTPVSPSLRRRARSSSPSNRDRLSSRRQPASFSPRYSRAREYESDGTDELLEDSHRRRGQSESGSALTSARSVAESISGPITPRCDFPCSGADFEALSSRGKSLTPDSILFRKPLRERFSTGSSSPYEKIRDRVRDLLTSPRANQIVQDSIAEANDRYWTRRSRSPSPRY